MQQSPPPNPPPPCLGHILLFLSAPLIFLLPSSFFSFSFLSHRSFLFLSPFLSLSSLFLFPFQAFSLSFSLYLPFFQFVSISVYLSASISISLSFYLSLSLSLSFRQLTSMCFKSVKDYWIILQTAMWLYLVELTENV